MLGLDLPPAPLYKDKDKKDIIPQVEIILTNTHTLELTQFYLARSFFEVIVFFTLYLLKFARCKSY